MVMSLLSCNPARPEHLAAFENAGINAYMGNNGVLSGIEAIATLMTNKQFFIVYYFPVSKVQGRNF